MTHPDEHTLELFAVGSPHLGSSETDVREHLLHCSDCRRIVEEKRQFYEGVGKIVDELSTREPSASSHTKRDSLIPYRGELDEWTEKPHKRLPFHLDVIRFVRHHPLASSGSFLLGLAFLLWIALGPRDSKREDMDPAYSRYNAPTGSMEAFTATGRTLWSKPVADPALVAIETGRLLQKTGVVDLKGDGMHEVVILTSLVSDSVKSSTPRAVVRLYDGNGSITHQTKIGSEVTFAGTHYFDQFGLGGMAILRDNRSRRDHVSILGVHFRSPTVVAVLAPDGTIGGEYWHYGHLSSHSTIKGVLGRPEGYVVNLGTNDAADTAGIRFLMMVVLDPARIRGKSESVLTRGFGYPPSDAEVAYIRFPDIDVIKVMQDGFEAVRSSYDDLSTIQVLIRSRSVGIEFVFSLNLDAISVRPLEGFSEVHERLRKAGKVSSENNDAYFERLRNGVTYWDGSAWSHEPVRISHLAGSPMALEPAGPQQ